MMDNLWILFGIGAFVYWAWMIYGQLRAINRNLDRLVNTLHLLSTSRNLEQLTEAVCSLR